MGFVREENGSKRSGIVRMKRASRQITILFIAMAGIAVALANSAHSWAASREGESASALAADPLRNVPSTPESGLLMGFTMADFTGDTHPDLATVELNGFDSVNALYVVEIRYSEGGRQLQPLTAPFGGLLITAKDVTGDGSLDLVIHAARSGAPLTVFLNDGSGHFTAAKASAFTDVVREATSGQKFTTERLYLNAMLISPKLKTIHCRTASERYAREQSRSYFCATCEAPFHRVVPFGLDRAPPAIG
jgi:hypothetical protein